MCNFVTNNPNSLLLKGLRGYNSLKVHITNVTLLEKIVIGGMNLLSNIPKLITIADLTKRWDMPRQSIHERKDGHDFPKPVQYVANGRTALYLESDIEIYEEKYPWISDPEKRRRRQRFIWSLINK